MSAARMEGFWLLSSRRIARSRALILIMDLSERAISQLLRAQVPSQWSRFDGSRSCGR
jgi:hypothetical protein